MAFHRIDQDIGINAFSRLPHTRSAASHSTDQRLPHSLVVQTTACPRGSVLIEVTFSRRYPDCVFAVVAR